MKRRKFLSMSARSAGAIVLSQCAVVRPQPTRSIPTKMLQTRATLPPASAATPTAPPSTDDCDGVWHLTRK